MRSFALGALEDPPTLDSAVGNTITGTVVAFDQAPSKFGGEVVIATIADNETGALGSLWLSSTVLVSQFARLKPQLGETVKVTYLGKRMGGSGEYKNYHAEAPERPPFQPSWDKLADDPPAAVDGSPWAS